MQVPYEVVVRNRNSEESQSLVTLLRATAVFLWKEWSQNMQLSGMDGNTFVLSGECPHCRKQAAFPSITSLYEEQGSPGDLPYSTVAALRCIACRRYVLGILRAERTERGYRWVYAAHYPLGTPDDTVADEIPDTISPDFREALRCRWVNAYNATVEMCRRALESSCLEIGADPKQLGTLEKMIDWVHGQGKITTPLRDMAHKIRLGGDRGAHPSTKTMTADDADAVIEFTTEYFEHVYVMPKRMAKFDFSRPKPEKK